ncbi:hypothetical protein LXL04_031782 [Taraxacum kok-saghyz]
MHNLVTPFQVNVDVIRLNADATQHNADEIQCVWTVDLIFINCNDLICKISYWVVGLHGDIQVQIMTKGYDQECHTSLGFSAKHYQQRSSQERCDWCPQYRWSSNDRPHQKVHATAEGIRSKHDRHTKQTTLSGAVFIQTVWFTAGEAPSEERIERHLSTPSDKLKDSTLLVSLSRSRKSSDELGSFFHLPLNPPSNSLSETRHVFFLSFSKSEGKAASKFPPPVQLSYQKRASFPERTCTSKTAEISIPIFSSSTTTLEILYQTPGIDFLAKIFKCFCLVFRHNEFGSTLNLQNHFSKRAQFREISDPTPKPPFALSPKIMFQATQLILFLFSVPPQRNFLRIFSMASITDLGALKREK